MEPFGILPGLRTKMPVLSGLPERTSPLGDDPGLQDPPEGLQGGPDGLLGQSVRIEGEKGLPLQDGKKVPSARERPSPCSSALLGERTGLNREPLKGEVLKSMEPSMNKTPARLTS